MAHMDIHFGFSINGVAALHTKILEDTELHPFYEIYPKKFSNKTNGITFRRWLLECDPALTAEIEKLIGSGFRKDALHGKCRYFAAVLRRQGAEQARTGRLAAPHAEHHR